jgi:hypothetical protein
MPGLFKNNKYSSYYDIKENYWGFKRRALQEKKNNSKSNNRILNI